MASFAFDAVNRVGIKVKDLTLSVENSKSLLGHRTASSPSSAKIIIENINFNVEPGQLVAIIGGSGSGKTTLLNALAGRDASAGMKKQGIVELNGLSPHELAKTGQLAFVQQHDRLLPNLTVRQTLRFAASLRLPDSIPSSQKMILVEEIILDLGLKEVADTVIGDDWKKGISGGEKRRVSVGIQLLVNPAVIFLDECTSGLDAFTSHALIETLVALCRKGRTICVSIHQPSTNVFNLFDQVVLLTRGQLVYAGSIAGAVPHFTQLGETIPLHQNPADWLIDITSIDNRDPEMEARTGLAVGKLVAKWKEISFAAADTQKKRTNNEI